MIKQQILYSLQEEVLQFIFVKFCENQNFVCCWHSLGHQFAVETMIKLYCNNFDINFSFCLQYLN